jgi:hypothetical protein
LDSKKKTLKRFFNANINSILGTICFHLVVIIVFLWFKIGEAKEIKKEQVLIEFNELLTPPEEKKPEKTKLEDNYGVPSLDAQTVHSIASNVDSKLDEEISTEKYEKQVMDELGMESTQPQQTQDNKPADNSDEATVSQPAEENKDDQHPDVPNVIRKENTTVSYFLENRWHRYLYIPTYKCQGGGTVILDLVVDRTGRVISAMIAENKSTKDPCLLDEAYRSAIGAVFNTDQNAPTKQLGTITYVFIAQ